MVDLHAHILHGVDDGAQSLRESLQMARMAVESGVRAIVMTPHCNIPGFYENYDSSELRGRFRELKDALQEENIPLKLYPGMEVFGRENLNELLRRHRLIPVNDGGYLLLEFDFEEMAYWMSFLLEEIQSAGLRPLVAHPERYRAVQEDPNLAWHWVRRGCALQVNKGSILGRFGRREQQTAELLLEHELAACVASDAHHSAFRTPHMRELADYLEQTYGRECVQLLMIDNPARILNSEDIVLLEPRGFRKKWF